MMYLSKSILIDVREAVGLTPTSTDFDTELIMHINTAISNLYQNGVVKPIVVTDETTTWGDLQNPLNTDGNQVFPMVLSYVTLSTKILFDPPPPSAVDYQTRNVDQILWRLKVAYESPYTTTS
jgi:hypothetical protein